MTSNNNIVTIESTLANTPPTTSTSTNSSNSSSCTVTANNQTSSSSPSTQPQIHPPTRQSSFLLKRKGLTINIDRSNEAPNIESDENIYLIKDGENINNIDNNGFRKPQSLTSSSIIPVNNNNNNNSSNTNTINNNNSNLDTSPTNSPLSTPSSVYTDSESSAPNTPVSSNYFNCTPKSLSQSAPSIKLKINLNNLNNNQKLQQLQQANNNNSSTNTTSTNNITKELGNSSNCSTDEEPPESSRWLGCDNDKFKIFDPICSKVTDYLYMGSETVASDREKLASFGITHILNVSHQCPNFFQDDQTLTYKKFPLLDNPSEDISAIFNQAIEFIESACAKNGRVFVHCQMGVSRSASICMLWIMKATRCSFEEASDLIKLIRPISRPNAGFQLSLLNWAIKEGIQAPNSHRCNNIDINTISARFQSLSLSPNIVANLGSLATEKSSYTIDDSN